MLADVICRIVSVAGTEEEEQQQVEVNVLFGAAEVPALVAKRGGPACAAGESFRVFPSKERARDTGAVGAQLHNLCESLTRDLEGTTRLLRAGGYAFENNGRAVVLWIRVVNAESPGTNVTARGRQSRNSLTSSASSRSVREKRLSPGNMHLMHAALSSVLPRDGRGVVLPLKERSKGVGGENESPNVMGAPRLLAVVPPWVWSHATRQFEAHGLLPNPDGFSADDLITKAKR